MNLEWLSSKNICIFGHLSPGQLTPWQLSPRQLSSSRYLSLSVFVQGRSFIQFSLFVFPSTFSIILLSLSSCSLVIIFRIPNQGFRLEILFQEIRLGWKIRLGNYNRQWVGGRINNLGQVREWVMVRIGFHQMNMLQQINPYLIMLQF